MLKDIFAICSIYCYNGRDLEMIPTNECELKNNDDLQNNDDGNLFLINKERRKLSISNSLRLSIGFEDRDICLFLHRIMCMCELFSKQDTRFVDICKFHISVLVGNIKVCDMLKENSGNIFEIHINQIAFSRRVIHKIITYMEYCIKYSVVKDEVNLKEIILNDKVFKDRLSFISKCISFKLKNDIIAFTFN